MQRFGEADKYRYINPICLIIGPMQADLLKDSTTRMAFQSDKNRDAQLSELRRITQRCCPDIAAPKTSEHTDRRDRCISLLAGIES